MLRALVVLLLLANLVFWTWTEGLLAPLGLAPTSQRNPARLELQVQPEAVRVLAPEAARAALAAAADTASTAPARGSLQCLEAGPFSAAAIVAAEQALVAAAVPAGSWVRAPHEGAPPYAVVLGPFGNREALQKKQDELERLRLPLEAVDLPGDGAGATPQPGFALGHYASRAAAEAALAALNVRGVRTARVMLLKPAPGESRLRVAHATPALAEQLRALSGAALGAGFVPCATPAAAGPR